MSTDRSKPLFYPDSLDFKALIKDYPPAPDYFSGVHQLSSDELHSIRETRFLQQIKRGWEIPFYRKHWSEAGLEEGDITSLDDLSKIPPYDVNHVRASLERSPPWGDFAGIDFEKDAPVPLVFQTSGGTTGIPRPMFYSPQDREVMAILSARRLYSAGVRPFDRVQVTFSLGLTNAGLLTREGIWKYAGGVPIMTGSGASTPTRRQVELLQAWNVNILMGFPAYLRHMAHVAKAEHGIDVATLGVKSLLTHLGNEDRQELEELWGAPAFDSYGMNECGTIAADCEHRSGMHVYEDAFVVEVNDLKTGQSAEPGERGTVFVTALYKHVAPIIRYNTNDISAFATDRCACGSTHRRLQRLFGRSDNMVKLRGVNIFPEAVGSIVAQHSETNGEYVCVVERDEGGREQMTVKVELRESGLHAKQVEADLSLRLKESLGLSLVVEALSPGETDSLTGLSKNSKIRRLIDTRQT